MDQPCAWRRRRRRSWRRRLVSENVFRLGPALRVGGEGGGGGFQIRKVNRRFRRHRHIDTQRMWAIGNAPPLCALMPLPAPRSHTPGTAPGPPVKTGARVRRFRGCNREEHSKARLLGWTGASQTLPSGVIFEEISGLDAHASFGRLRQQYWLQPMRIMVPLRCLPRKLASRVVVVPGCALTHFEWCGGKAGPINSLTVCAQANR